MPPRSAKKVPVKKPSPRVKKAAASPKVDEEVLPSVTEAEEQPVVADEEKVAKPVEEKVSEPAPPEPEAPAAAAAAGSAAEEGKDAVAGNEEPEEPEEEEAGDDMEDREEDEEEGDDEPEEETEDAGTTQPADEDDGEADEEDDSGSEDEANESEEEPTLDAEHLSERKKHKEVEIFIGGLNKQTTEEDLKKVFSAYGEIQSARIVRAQLSKKSKGFAFIRYANVEEAKKALSELQDGVEINGKRVGVSTSMDNDTLYLGNICKTWTKSQLLEALKGFGVEHVNDITLPDDPSEEGKILGYAFLEFPSHSEAMEALKRLKQPDAVLGCDRSARVAFARSPINVSEEALSQVKTVYLEGIASSWDEEKVKEVCKPYGEIENVLLSRNFSKKKRKDFGFVTFTSRESALACIEGIKTAEVGEGEVKINANLARPAAKSRFSRRGAFGGFKVKNDNNEVDQSKKNGETKGTPGKGKAVKNTLGAKGNKPSKIVGNQRNQKAIHSATGKRKGKNFNTDTRPFKKPRYGNAYGRPPPRYGPPPAAYRAHAYGGTSRPLYHSTDMEPHAGLVPGGKQGNPYGYAQSRHDFPPRSAPYAPGRHHPYNAPPSYGGYEGGYPYPGSGSYAPPYQRPYY